MTNGETNLSEAVHAMPGVPLPSTDTRRAQGKSDWGGAGWPPFRRALPAISLSFHPDSKTLEWGNSCGQKSILHGPFEVAATGNYGRRNLGYNLRESLHVR